MTVPPQGSLRSWTWAQFLQGELLDTVLDRAEGARPTYDLTKIARWWFHWFTYPQCLYGMREMASRRHGERGKAQRKRRARTGYRSLLATGYAR